MVSLKNIYLCKEQLSLLHIMVRASEVTIFKIHPDHWRLVKKISNSRSQQTRRIVLPLTDTERKLILQYNLSYCSNLGQALFDHENGEGPEITDNEALHLYKVATQIFLLIS